MASTDYSKELHIALLAVQRATQLTKAVFHSNAKGTLEKGDTSPVTRLTSALADRSMLVVLDNCEHLVEAAAALAGRLLAACPGLRILATGREPLGITGEHLWPVRPLPPGTIIRHR